jgi:hypothetical protein
VRGDNNVVVAPPSVHKSGCRYEWAGIDGFRTPILPAPEWLLDLLRGRKGPARSTVAMRVVEQMAMCAGERSASDFPNSGAAHITC